MASVVLMGYRGSGKSSVGRKLADRLWQQFVDTDDLVTRSAGKSIAEIFEAEGEEGFRRREAEAVADAIGRPDTVVALGGGAVMAEGSRQLIRKQVRARVYLKCEPAELSRRIADDPASATSRPALTAGGVAHDADEIARVLALREPVYRELATAELDVTHLSVDDAVVYVVRLM